MQTMITTLTCYHRSCCWLAAVACILVCRMHACMRQGMPGVTAQPFLGNAGVICMAVCRF